MMLATLVLSAAVGAAIDPALAPFEEFLHSGCVDGPPVARQAEDPNLPAASQLALTSMPMSADSLRFFITPDSYRGEGMLMVQIDSGLRRDLGGEGRPFMLATVGRWQRSCTVRLTLDECPQAKPVAERLLALRIPVDYGFETPQSITLHATSYLLQFNGERLNQLLYSQPGNPLQRPLEEAKEALRDCWAPALDALSKADRPR